jgi:hypothetical protein
MKLQSENLKGRSHFEHSNVNERIMLEYIPKEMRCEVSDRSQLGLDRSQ